MSLQYPRSNTGLVPSTHRNLLDKLSCVEEWCRLPPQPPPKIYRFKGGKIKRMRKVDGKKKSHLNETEQSANFFSKKEKKRTNCKRIKDSHLNSSNRPGWNLYLADPMIFEEGKEDRDRRIKVKFETNTFLRNQFNERKHRELVEKLLDYGLGKPEDNKSEDVQKRKSNMEQLHDENSSSNRKCNKNICLNQTDDFVPYTKDINHMQDQRERIKIRSSQIFASERNNISRNFEINGRTIEEYFEQDDYVKCFVSASIQDCESIQNEFENTGEYNKFVDELLKGLEIL